MLTAQDLERVYATYTSASWRGGSDPAGQILGDWLRMHWVEQSHPRPQTDPEAISPHAAGGRGIFWYEGPAAIYGFVPGRTGCYIFKRTEAIPEVTVIRPAATSLPRRLRPVAHFQSGTYARHLFATASLPTDSEN